MNLDLTWVYSTLSAACGAAVTWVFSRRKQNAETVQTELDNVQKAVEIWRQAAEDLKTEVAQLRGEVKDLQKVVADLYKENLSLKEQVSKFNP
jgi:peptidoglycan hydrolase CwlO-like protein